MITALDHFVLICPDLETGIAEQASLLGRAPDWQRDNGDGSGAAQFRIGNTALEIMAPLGDGPVGERLHQLLEAGGARLTSLAFATDNLDAAHHILTRRGLSPGEISPGHGLTRFRCKDEACAGIKTFILQNDSAPETAHSDIVGAATALDHIVINTPNPDRAAAQYGARLGLHLALDRTAPEWKTRFLFFRTGGLTFEVINRLDAAQDPASKDSIWGLTWATDDLEAAHARLHAAGRDLSEIRTGRKPGSRVFTVRDGTGDVPTLFIAHSPR